MDASDFGDIPPAPEPAVVSTVCAERGSITKPPPHSTVLGRIARLVIAVRFWR